MAAFLRRVEPVAATGFGKRGAPAEVDAPSPIVRRRPRYRVALRVSLAWSGGCCPATLRNLSAGGAAVEAAMPLRVEEAVTIAIPGLPPLPATVRWARAGRVGLRFGGSIPADALARLTRSA